MIFQRKSPVETMEEIVEEVLVETQPSEDNIDTVVGPSVNVEGDFASEGNIVVKGTVTGSVRTSKNLIVEAGAKIVANVRAGNASIAGEVRGNMKIKEFVELSATAKIVGDVEAKTIAMEAGALLYGKVVMPGLETGEPNRRSGGRSKRGEEAGQEISG